MTAISKLRKRDKLKAVFRSRLDRTVILVPAPEAATQSILQPSQPQENRESDIEHTEIAPNPTVTIDCSINIDDDNDRTEAFSPVAQDSLWEDALSKLETSSSMDDQSHARALREFAKMEGLNAIRQAGSAASDSDDLIQMVKRAADLRHAEADQKAWRVDVGTRTVVLRDVVTRIIDCLNKFKDIGDLVVQYDPVHAALPWAAFRFLLQAATLSKEQSGRLLIGIDAATQAYLRARIYQDLYIGLPDHQDVADNLKHSVINLLVAICAFLGLAIKSNSSSSVMNVARGLLDPESLARCIKNITETETQVEKNALSCKAILDAAAHQRQGLRYDKLVGILEAHTNHIDSLQRGLTKVELGVSHLIETLSDEEVHTIFSWISRIPYETDLDNARRGRLEGTCEWLIAHGIYEQWKASSVSTTLWLHGIPGAGKTKLSTKVVENLAPTNTHLAYFFCDRNRENRRDPMAVLHSITRQLSRSDGPERIHGYAVEAYKRKKKRSFASNTLTNEESRDILLNLANENPRNTIIIDGLDECEEGSRKCILDTLDYLVKHSSSVVKVFVASRNDKDLTQHYSSTPNLEIEAAHNQDDIEKLVMDRISSSQWAAEGMSVHVREAVVRLFRQKSKGMFQWASLHIDELLEFESDQAIMEWLHGLPEGLKAAYDRIYDGLSTKQRIYANRAFMWLMVPHKERISPELLCVLVCQDASKEFDSDAKLTLSSLLATCGNLIKVDDFDERASECSFAHLSVQEYLETHRLDIVKAERMVLEISIKFWQRVSATKDHKARNYKDTVAESTSYGNHTSTHQQLQWLTVRPVQNFLRSADMSRANQDIWAQLLQSTKGHDVVRGSSSWRALDKSTSDTNILDLVLRKSELRAISSPIGMCALFGNQAPIKYWIDYGLFDPAVDHETARELVFATYRHRKTAICNLLLDAGTNFKHESSDMMELRLEELFRLESEFEKDKPRLLIRLLQRLCEDGAPLAYSPRHHGVYNGTYPWEIARMFLQRGADPNVQDHNRKTPLMHAVRRGDKNIKMTELLLQHGAQVNPKDEYGQSPLHHAAKASKNLETMRLLLDHGADPNAGGIKNGTPLQHAAFRSNIEAAKFLLESNARVNAVSYWYGTALHAAALRGSRGKVMFYLLLAYGADPKIKCTLRFLQSPWYKVTAEQLLQDCVAEETRHSNPGHPYIAPPN